MNRLQVLEVKTGFLVLDPRCERAYPFVYSKRDTASRVASYIEQNGGALWELHKDGWLEPENVVLRAMN